MKSTAIISTVRHNIGDDFVREGILFLLDSVGLLGDTEVIHKHAPITARHGFEWVRNRRFSDLMDPLTRTMRVKDRIQSADMIVQSGAPVYWCHPGGPHCADNEWFDPLIRRRFLRDRRGRRLLNLAGGSCQRYHSDGREIDDCHRCRSYIREFFDACDLTLLRDNVARSMLNKAGRDAEVLPCTSIFARDRFNLTPAPGEYVVLNFMEGGGHYAFGQNIDAPLWRRTFGQLARLVSTMGRVVVACHTPEEKRWADQIVPELETFIVPYEHVAFMKFYAGAKWGIVNRVHAAFMMASFGKPAVVVGTDTRARMMGTINLPSYFVSDVTKVGIETVIDDARCRCASYPDEMEVIRSVTKKAYEARIK